ncbi:hypothetical protein [Vibrio owensii]|uniref:hypothetical protein n=1 Tax=Vibrio owensii TaxID=696485 RepID=UPI003CC5B897
MKSQVIKCSKLFLAILFVFALVSINHVLISQFYGLDPYLNPPQHVVASAYAMLVFAVAFLVLCAINALLYMYSIHQYFKPLSMKIIDIWTKEDYEEAVTKLRCMAATALSFCLAIYIVTPLTQ